MLSPMGSTAGAGSGAMGGNPAAGSTGEQESSGGVQFGAGGAGIGGAGPTDPSSTGGSFAGAEGGQPALDASDPVTPPEPSNEATPSSGCGSAPPESGRFEIQVEGEPREYNLRIPDAYDPQRAYPLVFAWHPWGGSADQVSRSGYHGLERVAGDEVILVAGEGIDFQGNGLGWANPEGRDEKMMRAMLDRFNAELCVDTSRVFSTGFSFGGMMSFTLGCNAADVIRAIAPMAGNPNVGGCNGPELPVAMLGFHGVNDQVVDISGGQQGRDIIRERNGCSESSSILEDSWCDAAGDVEPCSCVSYEGCDAGFPVVWCEFNGPHTPAANAGQTLWDFFSQF